MTRANLEFPETLGRPGHGGQLATLDLLEPEDSQVLLVPRGRMENRGSLVPLASTPAPIAARNWITRRMVIDAIKADPDWKAGNYATQPRALAFRQTVDIQPIPADIYTDDPCL